MLESQNTKIEFIKDVMDTLTWLLSIEKEEQAYKTKPQKSMTNDAKVQDRLDN